MGVDQMFYPRAPEVSLSAGANFNLTRCLTLETDLQFVDDQYSGNRRNLDNTWSNFGFVESYVLWNMKLNYELPEWEGLHTKLYVMVENLADTQYNYWPGYRMPGINVSFGVNLKY